VQERGDAPAGIGIGTTTPVGQQGVPVELRGLDGFSAWELANVVRGRANGTVSAYAHARLGDITSDQLRGVAAIQRDFDPARANGNGRGTPGRSERASGDGRALELRVTNRQNLVFRGLREDQLRDLHQRLVALDMATPGAELARDVVACPGADTCNLAVTQSRGLAADIDRALADAGLAEVPGVRINISGCTNSCGQHHTADIGFFGLERRAHRRSAPGYQMLLGGRVGEMEIAFGEKATKVPAKRASEAVVRVVGRYTGERDAGETFASWLARAGGAAEVGKALRELDEFPEPDEAPDFYVDFDETGPYEASVGDSECAT
jgi:sulfite reductase beta subunit-like hemoprotein